MLGLVLIYFIGKPFYDLANSLDKSGWLFAILGVLSYYLGTFIAGILLVILAEAGYVSNVEEMDQFLLSLIALPFGLFTAFVFYKILQKNWSQQSAKAQSDILDDDFLTKNN